MTCSYCRYLNSDDDHRCRRCGRPQNDMYATATAGALAAVPKPAREEQVRASEQAPPTRLAAVPRQARLFTDEPVARTTFTTVLAPPAPPKTARPASRNRRAPNDSQPSLEFLQAAPHTVRKLGTTVEASIVCDATVAAPMHRACAAAIDGSMILIGCGIFLAMFQLLGGSFAATKPVILVMGAAALLIAMFYGFVWVWAGVQTPGMRALSLTLINFDGYPPDRTTRWLRFVGACLGYCAVGLGLLWALLDEESLAWHDHISKTFPTFHGPETSFVRRR